MILLDNVLKVVRESDTWARVGGDEVGIIVSSVNEANDVKQLIKRIDEVLCKTFEYDNIAIPLKASIGYALFSQDGIELEMLIEKADQAMYASKRAKKQTKKS